LLRNIFSELPQLAAAIRTAITLGNVRDHIAGEMFWQRLTFRSGLLLNRRNAIDHGFHLGLRRLHVLKLKLKLLQLDDDLLALGAEHHTSQLLDHEFHVLDA
jgi:hypothetical protein